MQDHEAEFDRDVRWHLEKAGLGFSERDFAFHRAFEVERNGRHVFTVNRSVILPTVVPSAPDLVAGIVRPDEPTDGFLPAARSGRGELHQVRERCFRAPHPSRPAAPPMHRRDRPPPFGAMLEAEIRASFVPTEITADNLSEMISRIIEASPEEAAAKIAEVLKTRIREQELEGILDSLEEAWLTADRPSP